MKLATKRKTQRHKTETLTVHTQNKIYIVFFETSGRFKYALNEQRKKKDEASLSEKGVAGDAVEQVVGLPFGRFGQEEDLLLRHAGGNVDVALLERWKVLVVWRDRTSVTQG